ncbi:MAG: hypothetical protein QY326_09050 [Bdellovibrionota bacterium]|nr:MAG: hypothetical protein QY326_09050 [Bdellovibrionota bacterium]
MDQTSVVSEMPAAPTPPQRKTLRRIMTALVIVVLLRLLSFPLMQPTGSETDLSLLGLGADLFAAIAPLLCAVLALLSLLTFLIRLLRRQPGRISALVVFALCAGAATFLLSTIPR